VKIGGDLVCTGYVDATPIDYDSDGITVMVRGRSKTADLVDCSADNPVEKGQFKGLKAEAIAEKIAKQYGLAVKAQADTGPAITDHQIQQGETAFESLDRLARQRQILVSDNGAGDVVLLAPGSGGKAKSTLELGVNILSASAGFDYSEVYTKYKVKGQRSRGGDDADWDENSAAGLSSQGEATDNSLKRQRVLVVMQSGQADAGTCQKRAEHEQRIRAAKAREIRYKVAGWRQQNGDLWQPNMTVAIKDGIMQVEKELLVSECIWTLDEGGMVTELICISPDAFLPGGS
jgi:prophage tail gpP-like protein